jgi:hypothetical protein
MGMSRLASWCGEADGVAGALQRWSRHHLLATINPLAKLKTAVAVVVVLLSLAVGTWALIYRTLAFMSVDRRFGVFAATRHPRAVVRSVFLLFAATVAVKCLFEGRSVLNVACILIVGALGGLRAQRRTSSVDGRRPYGLAHVTWRAVTSGRPGGSN